MSSILICFSAWNNFKNLETWNLPWETQLKKKPWESWWGRGCSGWCRCNSSWCRWMPSRDSSSEYWSDRSCATKDYRTLGNVLMVKIKVEGRTVILKHLVFLWWQWNKQSRNIQTSSISWISVFLLSSSSSLRTFIFFSYLAWSSLAWRSLSCRRAVIASSCCWNDSLQWASSHFYVIIVCIYHEM